MKTHISLRSFTRCWQHSALVCSALFLAGPARAATFNASTPAQLIAAINSANNETAFPGADTIVLAAGTYSFATAVIWDFGPNALPVITSNITIEGHGAVLTSTAPVRLRFFYVAGNRVGGLTTSAPMLHHLTL